jgi:hypothetical protein
MNHRPLACLGLIALPGLASGQSFVDIAPSRLWAYPVNTVVAVTTDGLWIPDTGAPLPRLHLPAAAFPGAAGAQGALTRPAIEWDRRTDTFLVSAGPQLFRVTIADLSPPTWSIEEITPQSGLALDLWDLDLHPGSGELFLLDQTNDEVLRFERPFEAGMLPTLVLPVPPTSRSMAVDSRSYPAAVIVTETSQTSRVEFDGSSSVLNFFTGGRGLDQDPQVAGNGGSYMVSTTGNKVGRAAGSPNVYIDMNIKGNCLPLALAPTDVEWSPIKNRAYVFAQDGINQNFSCPVEMPATGPNHIVIFPVAQAPPMVVPKLYTYADDSGITGNEGDLTVVLADFSFMSPYGAGCSGGNPDAVKLASVSFPDLTAGELVFEVQNAAPAASVQFIVGTLPAKLPLAGGCDLLVTPDLVLAVGTTDGAGRLEFTWQHPFAPTPGLEVFVQVAVDDGGALELTQAMQVHFGE